MAKAMVFLVALVFVLPHHGSAQDDPTEGLSPGSTVRLLIQGETSPIEGRLVSSTPGVWALTLPDGEVRGFAPADVASVEVGVTHRNILPGTLIGGGLGLAADFLLGVGVDVVCLGTSDVCGALEGEFRTRTWARFHTPVLAAGVGALIGALVKTDGWVPVVAPQGPSEFALSWTLPVGF